MNFEKLDRYLDAQLEQGIPGLDIVVYQHGLPVHRYITGTCDYLGRQPLTENNLYWIYSSTKVTTMCAAMRLVEQGKLGLEDRVAEYIPAFSNMTVQTPDGLVPAKTDIKIKHLMSMSSGLDYDIKTPALLQVCRNQHAGTAEIVDAIAQRPLLFEPGTGYKYSLGHDVMARVIEVVSGKTFGQYLAENFWQPLGMTDTTMRSESDDIRSRLVAEFKYDEQTHTSTAKEFRNDYILSRRYESGGAGIITSVTDYGKFVGALANKGVSADGYRLLGMQAIDTMRFTQLPDEILRDSFSKYTLGYSYGLGVRCMKYPEKRNAKSPVGEFGWDGAAGTFVLADPENEIGIFLAMQVKGCQYAYFTVHPEVRDMVYEILLK